MLQTNFKCIAELGEDNSNNISLKDDMNLKMVCYQLYVIWMKALCLMILMDYQ